MSCPCRVGWMGSVCMSIFCSQALNSFSRGKFLHAKIVRNFIPCRNPGRTTALPRTRIRLVPRYFEGTIPTNATAYSLTRPESIKARNYIQTLQTRDVTEENGRVCSFLFCLRFSRFVWNFVLPSPSPLLVWTKLKGTVSWCWHQNVLS